MAVQQIDSARVSQHGGPSGQSGQDGSQASLEKLAEALGMSVKEFLAKFDTDGDRKIDQAEMAAVMQALQEKQKAAGADEKGGGGKSEGAGGGGGAKSAEGSQPEGNSDTTNKTLAALYRILEELNAGGNSSPKAQQDAKAAVQGVKEMVESQNA